MGVEGFSWKLVENTGWNPAVSKSEVLTDTPYISTTAIEFFMSDFDELMSNQFLFNFLVENMVIKR